jgi:hypothetical protein
MNLATNWRNRRFVGFPRERRFRRRRSRDRFGKLRTPTLALRAGIRSKWLSDSFSSQAAQVSRDDAHALLQAEPFHNLSAGGKRQAAAG